MRQDAASTLVLDDPVDISHANMVLEEVKYVGCGLTPEQKLWYSRPNIIIDLHLCTNFLQRQRTVVTDPCKAMNFERTLTTDISSEFMLSKVGWGVPPTMYLVCHRQSTKGFTSQWSFQQIKKLSYTLFGGHAIYTMAIRMLLLLLLSAVGCPRRTVLIRRYVLTWRRSYFGWFLIKDASLPIEDSIAGCALYWERINMVFCLEIRKKCPWPSGRMFQVWRSSHAACLFSSLVNCKY